MAYTKTVWENLPSTNTPINKDNLNKIENELETIDVQVSGIIESGGDSTAKYLKFADGSLIQYGEISLKSYTSRTAGGLTYWSQSGTANLPYNFIDTNYKVFTNVTLANMNYFCQSYGNVDTNNSIRISFISTSDEDTRNIHFICIGRWKS